MTSISKLIDLQTQSLDEQLIRDVFWPTMLNILNKVNPCVKTKRSTNEVSCHHIRVRRLKTILSKIAPQT